MTPDILRRIRDALNEAADTLTDEGYDEFPEELRDLLAALPPDPGGAMPEPWPGMVVDWYLDSARYFWRRSLVGPCHPPEPEPDSDTAPYLGPDPWRVVTDPGTMITASIAWTPNTIRCIRTPDGRVIWRAKED